MNGYFPMADYASTCASSRNLAGHTRLDRDFFVVPTRLLARNLLGTMLVRRMPDGQFAKAIVVEVEAYLSRRDPASHSHRGPGKSNASMFRQPGTLYVYPIHMRHCMNVVSEPEGRGAAVLIRAAEPYQGVQAMWRARFPNKEPDKEPNKQTAVHADSSLAAGKFCEPYTRLTWRQAASLTQGPGRLCEAMNIDRGQDGMELSRNDDIWLESPPACVAERNWRIRSSPRIGISKAKSLPLRWFIDGQRFVSGCSKDHSNGRHWSFQHENSLM